MNTNVSIRDNAAVAIQLDARAENVMLVRQAIEGAARQLGATGTVVDDIKLAVTEACSNVVKYAYPGKQGAMQVRIGSAGETITVVVQDFGTWQPHDTSGGLEASGMGIPLMKAVTLKHAIETGNDGTEVTLQFDLDTQDPLDAPDGAIVPEDDD
jgi:serine/threonine-protein kinase RsbW